VQTGSPSPVEVAEQWAAPVGPLLRPLVSTVIGRAVSTRRQQALAEEKKDRVGPYTKLRKLGGGGQAEVWLVKREGPRRYVMKIPRSPLTLRPKQRDELKRLLHREARLLESLHEAKVAAFYDHGWDGDTPYLVLQYLIGTDLETYSKIRPLTVKELKPIVRDVCLGLRALHERGIVHRDLKPSNIFLRLQLPREANEIFEPAHRDPKIARLSEAVLIDFGIAALLTDSTAAEEAEGTIGYLSPEQAQMSDDISGKSDVYGLAAALFTAVTGTHFFAEHSARTAGIIAHALEVPFDNELVAEAAATLPENLVALLRRATSLDPVDRPDVDDFSDEFAEL
jgi:serine/threonine-protein kinase